MRLSLAFRVPFIIPLPLQQFSLIVAQMFTHPCWLKFKVTRFTSLRLEYHDHSISLLPLEGFSSSFGQIVGSVWGCAEPMTKHVVSWSRSQLNVTGFNLWFPVPSIFPLPKVWMDGWMDVLQPFQQYLSHDRITKGRLWKAQCTEGLNGWMDGWMDGWIFYSLFSSILVMIGLRKGDHESLSALKGWMDGCFTASSTVF